MDIAKLATSMCNEEMTSHLKGNLQDTADDNSSALPKLFTTGFQRSERARSTGSLQESDTASLPCTSKSCPISTEQVNLENIQYAHYNESEDLQYDQHNESQEQLPMSLNVGGSALEGEIQRNQTLLDRGTLGRADASAEEPFTIGQSQVQCPTNTKLHEHPNGILKPIEQTQLTRAFSFKRQSNLLKSTPSSFNATDLPNKVHAQSSKAIPWDLKKAVQERVTEPIFGQQSKMVKGNSLVETLDHMEGIMSACGVNTAKEETYMLPKLTEERRSGVQEERNRFFLEKKYLREKVIKLANNWGVSFMNEDVELCLSLSLEEWLRRIVDKLIWHSDQRQSMLKGNPNLLLTSHVGGQVRMLRQKAGETLKENGLKRQKQAGSKKEMAKDNAPWSGETEEMLSRWQNIAEQARLKREKKAGNLGTISNENRATGLPLGTSPLVTADSGRPPGLVSSRVALY